MEESIRDMLANALDDNGDFDAVNFLRTLECNGYRCLAPLKDAGLHALAAAIEYFDGDIDQAIAAIERGEYRHCPNVYSGDYEELGREIIGDETKDIPELPELVRDYLNLELLGREMMRDMERGKFTNFGYFAPQKW